MSGSRDVIAGKSYVELYVKNSALLSGLKAADKALSGFGGTLVKIGAAMDAAGAAITAPIMLALRDWTEAGDKLNDFSERTGIAVEALSELSYAALGSCVEVETLEGGLRKMQKAIGDAATGGEAGKKALQELGLTIADVQNLAPDQQFETIADRISRIADPTMRAAAAMKIFGKTGTELLPMVNGGAAGIQRLRKEAEEMGLVTSAESAALADDLAVAQDKLKKVTGSAWKAIGSAIAPAALEAVRQLTTLGVAAMKWVKANKEMVATAFKLGAVLGAVGTAVASVGGGLAAIGIMSSGVTATLGAVSAIASGLAAIAVPLGIVVAALTAGGYAWIRWSGGALAALQGVQRALLPYVQSFRDTWQGVADALLGGDLALAAEVAFTGLQLVATKSMNDLSAAIGGIWGATVATFGRQILGGDFAGAWQTAVMSMSAVWDAWTEGVVKTFADMVGKVVDLWYGAIEKIANKLLELSAGGGVMGKAASAILGVDMQQMQAESDRLQDALGKAREDVLATAKADVGRQVGASAAGIRGAIEDMKKTATAATDQSFGDLAGRTGGAAAANRDKEQQLQTDLAILQAAAAAKRGSAEAARGKGLAGGPAIEMPDVSTLKKAPGATFSAAALAAIGGNGGPAQRQLDETRKIREINRGMEKLLQLQYNWSLTHPPKATVVT